ncbi:50S ribosomal protein L17 [Pyrinomonas methylaliphatogenes]|jgi:large subunit ribosomal protein L17|uniref:Large ribosomal subunit protein bL17 n=1 Tax=Pyrinomonas methylaliphatogenes TaxID=454194 RepID=A0A0B6WYI0_9BACT|nr:50S ribosomal protein L17 [Pyrinomonas methylaliphatogenes]CDM66141.1 ribosomal protein L17 [Pyrinomonas methylaliphatogenes]
MRHLKAHRKLGRTTEHRLSLLRNLATSLITSREERIITTLPKAKELRPFVERAITLSRRARAVEKEDAAKALHYRRLAAAYFHAGNRGAAVDGRRGEGRTAGVAALKRLFGELSERYLNRPGGYTRIIKLGRRVGDNAELAIIELVDNPRERREAEKRSNQKASKKGRDRAKSSSAENE